VRRWRRTGSERSRARAGKQSAGGARGLGVAVEAYRIWTEEDRNHSSPLNANRLVSSVLVPSEDSVSPGRNGFMILQYLSTLILSPPLQNA
jgi:hypothetical protein